MYGSVAVVRDQPKSASMGRRKRLNEFMLMEVIVTTPAQRSRTMLRERGMANQRFCQLCQIDSKITTGMAREMMCSQRSFSAGERKIMNHVAVRQIFVVTELGSYLCW
jgi:hypothetical protein